MKKSILGHLEKLSGFPEARTNSYDFPHEVPEVRRGGSQSTELLKALEPSYLVHLVPSFFQMH
jgi:hypothetical protein